MQKKTLFILILAIIIVIPFFQNTKEIMLYFFFWNFNLPTHFFFFGILLFGIICGYILAKIDTNKQNLNRVKKREEKKKKNLKNSPINEGK